MDGPSEAIRQPIKAQEGSTQGAVDGGTFFNMAINHAIKEANAALEPGKDGAMVAIADDIVGSVTPRLARQVLDIITQRFQTLRLKINYDKCRVLADTPELLHQVDFSGNPELARIKTTTEGITVLGAAI